MKVIWLLHFLWISVVVSEKHVWTPGVEGAFVSQPNTKGEISVEMIDKDTEEYRIKKKKLKKKFPQSNELQRNGVSLYSLESNSSSKHFFIVEHAVDSNNIKPYVLSSKKYFPFPPLLSYHEQWVSFGSHRPYVPSMESVKLLKEVLRPFQNNDTNIENNNSKLIDYISRPMPNMALQRGEIESTNLKLHLCNGVFEAYSAAYLTTREHMIEVKSEKFNLSYVNCEMASFIHMRESENFYRNSYGKGMIMQTLDVLDFSVIHLSAFERSSNKYKHKLWTSKKEINTNWKNIDAVKKAASMIQQVVDPRVSGRKLKYSLEAQKTIVIMPFLGGAMGAGHSELGNRYEYLKACFWSFYEFIPNIAMGVTRMDDVTWGMNESGLPFYEILLIENLPKSASLPVATTQAVKRKLLLGDWDFQYIFFTESDQILISRQLPMLYQHLMQYPSHMILPHRLMPYSQRVIQEVHHRNVQNISMNDWMFQSCCLPRQNCVERKTWKYIYESEVPIIDYYGLYVPLGNVNYLREQYRFCTLSEYLPDYCP